MTYKTWKVEITLKLEEDSNPRKWLIDTIWDSLRGKEDIIDYSYKDITVESTNSN